MIPSPLSIAAAWSAWLPQLLGDVAGLVLVVVLVWRLWPRVGSVD